MDAISQDNLKDIEKQARKRAKELKRFYGHLIIYTLTSAFLAAISVLSSPDYFWAIWPILSWGFVVATHALSVFGLFGIGTKAWEERKVQEFVLAQQKGLNASQVRTLLRQELDKASATSPVEMQRMVERLENIEAIVTSQAWDSLPEAAKGQGLLQEDEEVASGDTEKAERLARRIR